MVGAALSKSVLCDPVVINDSGVTPDR